MTTPTSDTGMPADGGAADEAAPPGSADPDRTGTPAAGEAAADASSGTTEPAGHVDPDQSAVPTDQQLAARVVRGLRWWREIVYIIVVYVAYSFVRNLFGSGEGGPSTAGPAYDNAVRLIDIQRSIGLYFEQNLQEWYLDLPADGIVRIWNVFYGMAHFIVPSLVLIWMFRKFPTHYRVWRNTLMVTTMLALVGFATYPLMPPRLLDDPGVYGGCQIYAEGETRPDDAGEAPCDEYGFEDTIAVHGGWASFGSDEMASVSNQFAAMPSMHIGWSTWVLLTVVPLATRRSVKALAVSFPLITLFVIVVTGNHYWIDALGGLACLAIGYGLSRWGTDRYESHLAQSPT